MYCEFEPQESSLVIAPINVILSIIFNYDKYF